MTQYNKFWEEFLMPTFFVNALVYIVILTGTLN